MSEENVVRRNPKTNRRKNTDGYRTDSGCFEDVDLQLATRHSPSSDSPPSDSVVVDRLVVGTNDHSLDESRRATEHGVASPNSLCLADECADDKDFHAILKRLADITKNPGDLYRLCFSSRLSFCDHMAGNTDDEGSFIRTAEGEQNDVVLPPTESCKKCEILSEAHLEKVGNDARRSSRGEQYVELLSLLSSFMAKAKENPNVFEHSSLGNSLVHQLSSLLSTLEEARTNPKHANESKPMKPDQQALSASTEKTALIGHIPAPDCVEMNTSNLKYSKTSLAPDNSDFGVENIDVWLNDSKDQKNKPSAPSNRKNYGNHSPVSVLKTTLTPSDLNKEIDDKNGFTLKNSSTSLDEQKPSHSQTQNTDSYSSEASSPTFPNSNAVGDQTDSVLKSSADGESNRNFMNTFGSSDSYIDILHTTSKDASDGHNTDHLLPRQTHEMPLRSYRTAHVNRESGQVDKFSSDQSGNSNQQHSPISQTEGIENSLLFSSHGNDSHSEMDKTDPTWKAEESMNQDEVSSPTNQAEDTNHIADLTAIETRSSTSSETGAGDVVTNGRRAVKPYSWDYGDIWEKELERTKSSESFQNGAREGHSSSKRDPSKDLMPSFEEIRDELFRKAGFLYDNGSRSDVPKRRSRSADARSTLQDSTMWPEFRYTQNEMHSPFVRTVYQDEARSSPGLRRSWSSHHISGDSMMVNIDWTCGRQMRVISRSADHFQGFDDIRAQIIKEAVVKTSTHRGPKPWSVLKRRPSGLRRRSPRNQSLALNTCDDSGKNQRARSDPDSESSDSPYVSATSSDCLTTATDDSSSVTSSQYYAASSLPSSPSVSNRNSACFSDTSTSDASEIRRVVFQSSSLESVPRERYLRGYEVPNTRGMSLDQRFGFIQKCDCIPPSEDLETSSLKGLRGSTRSASEIHDGDFSNLQVHSSTLPRKWVGDRQGALPLLVRSDSDLIRMTKVQFVGDSYSRSRISKNVRPTRTRSQSPSPVGPRSAHSRVVSCEIVQSDKGKRDVYTKVNIAESLKDAQGKFHDGRSMKLGHPSTRRSWHGQSPTRVPSRHVLSNRSTGSLIGPRCPNLSGCVPYIQQDAQVAKPVHATLVAVNNDDRGLRTHWSTGSFRSSLSERPRLMSDTVVMNRQHGYPSINCSVHSNFERNFNGGNWSTFGRARVPFGQQSAVGIRPSRRRSPPDYLTAIKHAQGLKKKGQQVGFKGTEGYRSPADRAFSTKRDSPVERNRFSTYPKEPMSHVVKETSFVGPSTFTRYQSSENPSFSRSRRSRSLNEKDTMSRRRLHDSDFYRRRAIEISQSNRGDGNYLNQFSRWESNIADVRRPERRRRYSEGAKHDTARSEGVVDASYCDPRRESIREGTYSIVNAESARDGSKSDEIHVPDQMKCENSVDITSDCRNERTGLQNGGLIRNRRSLNDFADERMSGIAKKSSQLECLGKRFSTEKMIFGSISKQMEVTNPEKTSEVVAATELPYVKKDGKSGEVNDFSYVRGQDKKSHDTVDMISKEECRTSTTEEKILTSVLQYSDPNKETTERTDTVNSSTPLRRTTDELETAETAQTSPNETRSESNVEISQILPDGKTNEPSGVILAKELPCRNMDETNEGVSSRPPDGMKGKTWCIDSQKDPPNHHILAADNKVTSDTELQYTNKDNTVGVLHPPFPCTRKDKTNNGLSHQVFPYKQVDEVDETISELLNYESIDGNNLVFPPALPHQKKEEEKMVQSSVSPSKKIDKTVVPGEMMPHSKEKTNFVVSPVLPNRKAHEQTKEVNVFIDYRNKRPVSVEYSDEGTSLLLSFGANARASKRDKQNSGDVNKVKSTRKSKQCSALDEGVSEKTERIATSEEEGVLPRLSRRDRHEQEVLATKVKHLRDQQPQALPVSLPQPSPVPYRRDNTIIFTDARTSFGSDTDSISRESTVSSSGSDMTVILHDEMDISANDLKQLTESGSKIGIDIAPIDEVSGDESFDGPNSTPVKMPPAMEVSTTFKNYPKRLSDNVKIKPELVFGKEAASVKENAHSFEKLRKNLAPKRVIVGQNNACLSHDNLVASSCNEESSSSSIASSRASSKSTGTETSNGKHASRNSEGGKGFFSRLKSFRNSFRTKMTGSNSPEKSGKKAKNSARNIKEREGIYNGSQTTSQNVPPTDTNANLVSRARNRTKSDAGVVSRGGTKGDLSRRSYDVFQHPNNNLRNVVGVKSVSSDHLNTYRINNIPHMDEINAKSLDVLVETCI